MPRLKTIAAFIFGMFLLAGGVNHFVNPEFYAPLVPSWLPLGFANWSSGIIEIILGIGLFIPASRKWAAWGSMALMVVFLPLHVWDVLRDDPVMKSTAGAWVRLAIQFLFIGWTWWLVQPDERLFKRR